MNNEDPTNEPNEESIQSKGGKARSEKLTPEEKKAIAQKAAEARWGMTGVPRASHDGDLDLNGNVIKAAVLPNGKRLITQGTMLLAIGRSRTPKGGTGGNATVDELPFFLQAEALQPFISDDLRASTTPIFFRLKDGQRAVGYDAQLLPGVCEVYLKFRDACVEADKPVPRTYRHIIRACDLLMRALAAVGIVALVDEATGYQEVRDRLALREILKKYISGSLLEYASMFPIIFYKEMFRLKGWKWNDGKMPGAVGGYTNDLVYSRITPGLLGELQRLNPTVTPGRRKHKNFQWMTKAVGHPALERHLYRLIGLMEASDTWEQFKRKVDLKLPKCGQTLPLDLGDA